jgi:putative membrane protein
MSVKTTFALMLALASTAAAAETVTEKTGVNSALGIAPKTQDFVTEAAVSDMTEIAAAKVALQKGDGDEKQFADQMVKDHTQTSTELKALVSGSDVQATLPTAPDSASQKQIDKLNAATQPISGANTIPCRLGLTKARSRSSNVMPRGATTLN